jgi:hypothetical protein
MNQSLGPSDSVLKHAAHYPLRLIALFLLVLAAVAACGVKPANQGPTKLPATSGNKAMVCLSPSHPSPAGGCIVEDAATGISLRVTSAYADVTSTVVQLETTNTDNYPLGIWESQLALQSGPILHVTGGYSGPATILTVFEPVPQGDFGALVHFVATAHFMPPQDFGLNPPTPPPAPPWLNDLESIAVSVPFAIPAVRLGGYTYHQAPVVKQGIGVQVQSLEYSPSHTSFYGTAGGACIELLFSGLPADLELLSFIRLQSHESFGAGEEGDNGPGLLELQIPGMSVSTPAFTLLQNPAWPNNPQTGSVDPTVGSAGTVRLEVSYQGSGTPTGQPATLAISQIQLLTGGIDGNSGTVPVLPTYQITLPLS